MGEDKGAGPATDRRAQQAPSAQRNLTRGAVSQNLDIDASAVRTQKQGQQRFVLAAAQRLHQIGEQPAVDAGQGRLDTGQSDQLASQIGLGGGGYIETVDQGAEDARQRLITPQQAVRDGLWLGLIGTGIGAGDQGGEELPLRFIGLLAGWRR